MANKFECAPAVNQIIHHIHDQAVADNGFLAFGIALGNVVALLKPTEKTMMADAKATPCPQRCNNKIIGNVVWSLSHINIKQLTQVVGKNVIPIAGVECDIGLTGTLDVVCELAEE